jgi:hypothetical protein
MASRRCVGVMLSLLSIGSTVLTVPTAPAIAAESAAYLATCSDPDSFGSTRSVGENRLALERVDGPEPRYHLVATWSRWDGQDLAESAERDLGRTIDWQNARLVVRIREENRSGETLLTHEHVVDGARYSDGEASGGMLAAIDVDQAIFSPKSGGSVYAKIRVERPGLDLATCWAALPSTPPAPVTRCWRSFDVMERPQPTSCAL